MGKERPRRSQLRYYFSHGGCLLQAFGWKTSAVNAAMRTSECENLGRCDARYQREKILPDRSGNRNADNRIIAVATGSQDRNRIWPAAVFGTSAGENTAIRGGLQGRIKSCGRLTGRRRPEPFVLEDETSGLNSSICWLRLLTRRPTSCLRNLDRKQTARQARTFCRQSTEYKGYRCRDVFCQLPRKDAIRY